MARAYGSRARMALAFESVYGTPPTAGWRRMPFVRSGLGSERGLVADDLLGYGRDPRDPIPDAEVNEGAIEIPMDAEALGVWLKALFGEPVTTGAGPYVHAFRSGGYDLPSFSVEIGMPEVPHYAVNAGCKAESLSWSMSRSGQLTATVSLVGRAETLAAETVAPSPAAFSTRRFGHVHGALTRNGAALGALGDVVGASFTYANALDRIEAVGDGGRIAGADPTMAALTGSLEVRFASQALLLQAVDGTPCEIEVVYAHPNGETLTWTVHRVFLPRPRTEIAGPGGVQAVFDWQAAHDVAEGRMATVVLTNDVASYSGAAAPPEAFASGDWMLSDSPSAGGDTLSIGILGLPANGGSAITGIEMRVGGGAAQALGAGVVGAYPITVLAGTEASVEIRAVNAVGAGPWSAAKTATPTVSAPAPVFELAPVWKDHLATSSEFHVRSSQAGTLYMATLADPPADAAAVKAAAHVTAAVQAGVDEEINGAGFTAGITTVYAVIESATAVFSAVVAVTRNSNAGKFVTETPDLLTAGAGSISGDLRVNTAGAINWGVYAAPQLTLTPAEVKAGAGSPVQSGSDPIATFNVAQPFSVTGLAPGDYVLFLVSETTEPVFGEFWRIDFTAS